MNKLFIKHHIFTKNRVRKKEKNLLELINRLIYIDILLFILWIGAILSVVMIMKTLFFEI